MSRTTHTSTGKTVLLASLVLIAASTVSAQVAGNTEVEPTLADQATPGPEVEPTEPEAAAESDRCPRCGRQKRWRSQSEASGATDDSSGRGRCRCGQGGCRRARGRSMPSDSAATLPAAGRGRGRGRHGGGKQAEMTTYRELLENHASIERTFEEIPGGIRSLTTTSDPALVPVLRRHVRQMVSLLENGGWIRVWDPLFAEIFEHAGKIETSIEEIEGGVAVTETSQDEQVTLLIRAHAAKVMEFAARGTEAYDEPTPLPEGYQAPGR